MKQVAAMQQNLKEPSDVSHHCISKMLELTPSYLIDTRVLQNGYENAKGKQNTFLIYGILLAQ